MGFVLAVAIIWFAFGRWRWRHAQWAMGWSYGPMARASCASRRGHARRLPVMQPWQQPQPPRAEPPRETAFDALKRRYVSGELNDEQYEQELDTLFSTRSGWQLH
jgi:hypothetical protein